MTALPPTSAKRSAAAPLPAHNTDRREEHGNKKLLKPRLNLISSEETIVVCEKGHLRYARIERV